MSCSLDLREYPARCPVCRTEHVVQAYSLNGATWADGHLRYACPGQHSNEEIRHANRDLIHRTRRTS